MITRRVSSPRPLSISLARFSSSLTVAAALSFAVTGATRAATKTWDGDATDFLWGTAANWNGDTLPAAASPFDDIVFGASGAGTIALGAARGANSLLFNLPGFVLSDATQQTLTLTSGNVTVNSGVSATVNSLIAGTNGVTLSGGGTLILGSANTFTGATTINGGSTLQLTNLGALSTSVATVNSGGTLALNAGAGTLNNSVVINGGTLSHVPSGQLDLGATNAITVNNVAGNTIDVTTAGPGGKLFLGANQLAGAGSFTKTGAGTLQLSAANTGFTGSATVNGGQLEVQNGQGLGNTAPTVTVGGTGELVISNLTWNGAIIANSGGAISGDNGNSVYSGPITANGQFSARARDFYSTGTARTLTLSGPISGSGGLIAQGPTAGTGRIVLTGNNAAWTGALQVDPNTQAVATVGFGTGAVTSLPSGDLTLNGGRLTITPSIGTGLTTTPGVTAQWFSTRNSGIQNTFATPWFTVPLVTTTVVPRIDVVDLAGINTTSGLPGNGSLPQNVGTAATSAFIDSYAITYNGLLNITNGGSYTFTVPSDDGASLFIDGQQVVANEGGHGVGTIGTGTVNLTAGAHQITLKNTNGGTGGGIQLAYQGPDQPVAPTTGTGVTNMATTGVTALTNVTGGLNYALSNTITVPAQAAPTSTILETSGFNTTSSGAMNVGANGNLIFASATSHAFTQNGPVTLAAGAGLASSGVAVTVPVSTTLAPANAIINGTVTLAGNANLNADGGVINSPIGLLTVNGVITDGAGTFGITKNGSGGTVVFGGTAANTFDGAFNMAQGVLLLNKPAGVNAIGAGGLNLDTSIVTSGTTAQDFAVVRLMANEQIDDASTLNVLTHNTADYGVTLDLNNFTETVGTLNVRGATTNMGRVVTGVNGKLIINGDITLSNNRNASGNTGREALITGVAPSSNALNLFQPGTGELSLGGATRNITANSTVTQANTDGTIDSIITNGGIIKLGGQRLVLNGSNPTIGRNSTFSGGIALNDGVLRGGGMGAQTDSAFGTGTLTINKGLTTASGGIAAGAATVELRNNGAGVNTAQGGTVGGVSLGQAVANTITYGNPVNIAATVPIAGFDVNNYAQAVPNATLTGSGGTMVMGTLTTAAAAQINVTGGNNYALRFNGFALGGDLTVLPTTGNLQLNNIGTAGPRSITSATGTTGSLIIGGDGAGYSGTINLANGGTLRLAPAVGVTNNQLGGATVTGGSTTTILGISPTVEGGSVSGAGAVQGGLLAKFYQTNAAQVINQSTAYNLVPSGVMRISSLSDAAVTNRPPTVTGTSFTNDLMVASGLLNITTAGSYTFQTFVDDESQLVIDGIPVVSVNAGGGGTGIIHSPVSAPITLSAGFHTITMKVSNQGGGGGYGVSYSGADSNGIMRPIPSSALYTPALFSNVANTGVNRTIADTGSFTLDGGGTDLDGGINNLTFSGATGTLNVTNGASTLAAPNGTGVMTVSGTTSLASGTTTLNPTTGSLGLIGDVSGLGAMTKTGAGLLILSGAKTFSGQFNINVGGVQVTDAGSLGTTAGATVVASGAVLDLNGVALGAEPLSLAGTGIANVTPAALWNSSSSPASASGPITLTAAATVGGFGDITLSGAQSGNFALTKIGPNTLTITGASTNTAGYTVSAGFLKVGNAAALGTNAGTTTVAGGGVLDLNGFSLNEPLNLTGAGTTNYGTMNSLASLISTAGSVTHSGNIVLGGAATIGSNSLGAGNDLTISGVISAAQALTKAGGNTVTLTAANTYTGNTTVNLGTLALNGNGALAAANTLTANPTTTVTLDNSATNVNNRLGGTKAITLVGGNLNIIGNAGAATSEALGGSAITASSNQSVITLLPNAAQALTLSSTTNLARANNGTILIRGTNLGSATGAGVAQVTFGGTAQTIGQFGAAGTKNRAIIPWAVMDTSATGDGASFVAIGANGVQALNTASEYDIDTITGPNNILAATANINAPAGTTLINSLTLANAGAMTIGAGNTVILDSGAIGTNTSTTIGGAGTLNSGNAANNNLREIIVYTSGASTNLTISATLASSVQGLNAFGPSTSPNIGGVGGGVIRGNFTKSGSGTLTLATPATFPGTTRLNGGTTVLAGGNNTILFPATTAPAAGSLASGLNSANLVVNAGATLDLNGTSQRFGGFASNLAAGSSALPGQGGVITNNSTTSDSTIYFSQGASFTVPTSINQSGVAGAMKTNVVRDGGFTLTLTAPNTYTGTTTINGGLTVLQDGATLSGTSSITLNRAALRIDDSQTILTPNRIPVTTPINLNGGSLAFVGRGGGTQNVWNVGTVNLGLGVSLLQETMAGNANANSAGSAQVNVGNIVRTTPGAELTFNFVQSGAQNMGDNPRFFISQINGGALPAPGAMLPAWITVGGQNPASAAGGTSGGINNIVANTTDFAQYDPTTGLRPLLYTSVIAPGNNVNLGQTTTLPVGDTLINSLRLDGGSTLVYGDAGYDTLNIQSGGLLGSLSNNNRAIGTAANGGKLTAGGLTPAANTEFFIYNGTATLTINARIIDNPNGGGSVITPVFSSGGFGGAITLTGSNTYTGTTYVNGVNLNLNNTVGGFAIPGNLIASGNTSNGTDSQNPSSQTITLNASNQIAPTATVTLNGGTLLSLGANNQTLANLVFGADGGSFNNQGPSVQTTTGTLTITGNITATNLQQATTIPAMQGNLAFPAGSHTVDVGTFPGAPGQVGLAINSVLSGNGTIEKTGAGILGLGAPSANASAPAINVNSGGIQFTTNNTDLSGSVITLAPGTVLSAGGFVGTVGALGGTGTVTSIFGPLAQAGGQVNTGGNNSNSTFAGLVTGTVAMGKVGTGSFSLTNPANDYTGGTLVNGGNLILPGAGLNTTGTGLVTVNNSGSISGSGNINGGLRMNPGSSIAFAVPATPGTAPINTGSSGVTSLGLTTFNFTGTPAVGVYPLINYGGSAATANQLAGIKIGTTPSGGLLYGVINNAASTSIDLTVETVHPSQTWTGAANGTWDTTTNNWSGTYTDTNQVVFNDSGANRTITGGQVNPQAITVSNSATNSFVSNDYTIVNSIGGSMAGGLTKSGSGTLRLTGNNTFGATPITVNEGILRASVSSTSNSLGSGSVALGNGTTLQLDPIANASTNGITGRYFHQPNNSSGLGQALFSLPAVAIQTDPGVNITWNPTNRPANGAVGSINGANWESFGAQWIGKVSIPAAGPWSFFTNSDDATRVFIDGVLVSSLDGGKGNTEDGGVISLTAGLHDVRFEFLQSTGGAQAGLSWQGPGVAKSIIPAASLFTAENVAGGFADNNVLIGTNVSVAGTSTINLSGGNFTAVQLGALTIPGASTLNVIGNGGKQLRAGATFLNGGTVTLNTVADVNLGQILDGGVATTIVKQGSGRLVLDNTNPIGTGLTNTITSGSVFEVQGGKLVAMGISPAALPLNGTNPLGSAQVRLNGGGLLLDTKLGSVTFDNAIAVAQNATIESVPNNNTVAATIVTLSGGISVSGGSTVNFDMYGGARAAGNAQNTGVSTSGAGNALTVSGPITGTGNLTFRSSQFNQEQYPVYGTATLTANNTISGTTTLNGGYAFQNVVNPLIVTLNGNGRLSGSTGITINAAQLTLDDSATVNSGRILAGAPLSLREGTVNLLLSTSANSGETFGTVNLDAGWNRIVMQNTPGANITGSFTGSSLIRNNRSAIQFQAINLGTAATAASLVKFTTAPALTGGGGAAASPTISILPYAVGASNPGTNPPTFMPVTYDATNGIRALNTTTEITTLGAAVANANARSSINAATTTAGPSTVGTLLNSWTVDNSANAAQTLTLDTNVLNFSGGAGLILFTATNGTQSALTIAAGLAGNGINFGTTEGHIIVTNTAGATIQPVISGSNGLTVSGNNNINSNSIQQLSGGSLTLTGANTFTGPVTINGRLIINNGTVDTPLGDAANGVNFGGGTLVLNNAGTTVAATRTVTMLQNSFGVIDTNGNANTIAGPVTGAGGLVKVGGGTLTLSNAANDYSGTTTIFQGNLVTSTGPQGNLVISGNGSNVTFAQATNGTYTGSITGIGSVTINNTAAAPITITLGDPDNANAGVNAYGGGTTFANTNAVVLRGTTSSLVGGIVTQANDSIVYEQNFDGLAGSVISGPAPFSKLGTGKVTLVNQNTYSGATSINGGTLSISSAGNLGDASPTNTIGIANGATLQATSTFNLGVTRSVVLGGGGGKIDVPNVEDDLTVSGAISGAAGDALTKTGFGKASLSGSNSYAGETNVNAGTLAITATGSIAASAGVTVASGADFDVSALTAGYAVPAGGFLRDDGVVTGDVVASGNVSGGGTFTGALTLNSLSVLSPGDSPGNLTVNGATTFNAGSTLSLEIAGTAPGTQYDRLTVGSSGGISITGGQITLSLGFAPFGNEQFTVINNLSSGPISGVFSNLPNGGLISATFGGTTYNFVANYAGGTGNDLILTVPEPTSATALLAGIGMAAGLRRFRRKS